MKTAYLAFLWVRIVYTNTLNLLTAGLIISLVIEPSHVAGYAGGVAKCV